MENGHIFSAMAIGSNKPVIFGGEIAARMLRASPPDADADLADIAAKVVSVTGGVPLVVRELSADTARCGCELSGQSGHLHCADVDCEGCTIHVEHETCRHVFIHLDRFKKFDAADREGYVRVTLKGARRRQHRKGGVDSSRSGHGEAGGTVIADTAACGDPDGDPAIIFLNHRPFSVVQLSDSHDDDSFRAELSHGTIAAAGVGSTGPGGDAIPLPDGDVPPHSSMPRRAGDAGVEGPARFSAPAERAGQDAGDLAA